MNSDRVAIDIEAFVGNAQLIAAIDHLAGKRLIDFLQTDIVVLQTKPIQQFRYDEYRPDTHLIEAAARDRNAAVNA